MSKSHDKIKKMAERTNMVIREGVRRGMSDKEVGPLHERYRAKSVGGVGKKESQSPYQNKVRSLRKSK